jgi:hypothetical protein
MVACYHNSLSYWQSDTKSSWCDFNLLGSVNQEVNPAALETAGQFLLVRLWAGMNSPPPIGCHTQPNEPIGEIRVTQFLSLVRSVVVFRPMGSRLQSHTSSLLLYSPKFRQTYFTLAPVLMSVSYLTYSWTLKMVASYSSEKSVDIQQTAWHYSAEGREFFINAGVRTSNSTLLFVFINNQNGVHSLS